MEKTREQYIDEEFEGDEFIKELDREVQRIKKDESIKQEYLRLVREVYRRKAKSMAEGRKMDTEQEKSAAAMEMVKECIPVDIIAEHTQLSIEKIQDLAKENHIPGTCLTFREHYGVITEK